MKNKSANWTSILPFLIFVGLYLFVGIFLTFSGNPKGFYAMPAAISVIVGIIFAFIIYKGTIDEKFNSLIAGCGDNNIIIMCLIFLLAGAFGSVTEKIGGVESTVNLGLRLVPSQFIVPGMFLIACFVCLAIGTSMGTIATIGPICITLAAKTGIDPALLLGALLGGAMFGNNMSIIADTGIAITRILDVSIKEKFKVNIKTTGLAVIGTVILYFFFGNTGATTITDIGGYNLIKILPYIAVLVISLMGVNVFVVLTLGIILAGGIGVYYGDFSILGFTSSVQAGFLNMFDVLIFSLLIGGLAAMVKDAGGIEWLNIKLRKIIVGRKSAQFVSMLLPGAVDASLANDTVTCVVTGPIVKDISDDYQIDRRKSASLMHTTVCVLQSILPYGAQILLATSLTSGKVSPIAIIPFLWYGFLALGISIITIFIPSKTSINDSVNEKNINDIHENELKPNLQ
ncbi:Na+/H+ antiporter NhaC family protein [Companilactobacillus furfuricola]|uniref:Na+/H+ antiporter NhaC family protein n=1 Tax=Companilactobacillus furfuricola TaxID=1462575 RepID=UPI000F76BFEF|nr:Na+/H+ antiporter NhaC family protein [Companilactobacillus furfuricola]